MCLCLLITTANLAKTAEPIEMPLGGQTGMCPGKNGEPLEGLLPTISQLDLAYTQGEVTSLRLWSRYDRHFVGITRYNAFS